MKKIIYSLLLTTAITGSAVLANQAPQRPTTGPKVAPQRPTSAIPTNRRPLKADDTICPKDLKMEELKKLKAGKSIDFEGYNFTLHTPQKEFNNMVPDYSKLSIAHIADHGRAIVSTPKGLVLDCKYTFRTAIASKVGGDHKTFTLTSEPTKPAKDLPEGLAEAIAGG